MSPASLLILLLAWAGGAAATWAADHETTLVERLAGGLALGLALLGLAGLVLASWLGMTAGVALLAGVLAASPLALVARGGLRRRLVASLSGGWAGLRAVPRRRALLAALLTLGVGAAVGRVWDRAFYVQDGAIYTGIDHNLGDLPFHLAIVAGFVRGDNLPPEHPELAGARLTYPFLVDFVAALLCVAGAGLRAALFVEGVLLALALVALVFGFARRLTGDPLAAALAAAFFLLNGGLGWLDFVGDLRRAPDGLGALLLALPRDYTIAPEGLRFANVVLTLLVPQRAFLLGLPLALLGFGLWWEALGEPVGSRRARQRLLAAGGVAGLLPLAHAHSLAVLLAVAAALALLFRRRDAAYFFAPALLLALPQAAWLAAGSAMRAGSFLAWQPGWEAGAGAGALAWLGFWLRNTGLLLPLLIVALAWRGTPPLVAPRLARFYVPFAACFVVPNLLRLSPWIWDNIKFLAFWLLASTPLVASLVARLLRGGRLRATAGAAIALSLTLAGAFDLWRAASGAVARRLFDREGIAFAEAVAAATLPHSRVLVAPTYDHPVLLSGRRVAMGYEGHLWSQGLDYLARKREVEAAYAGERTALGRLDVGFAVLGPPERGRLGASEPTFAALPVVAEVGPWRLYQVQP